jgi:hypothetical protein
MHVLVGIHMVEMEASCPKRLKLRPDLHRELAANSRQTKEPHSSTRHVPVEFTVVGDEVWYLAFCQRGIAIDQNEMQADVKSRKPARAGDSVGRCRRPDHQTRRRQNAVPVCVFDSPVDGDV